MNCLVEWVISMHEISDGDIHRECLYLNIVNIEVSARHTIPVRLSSIDDEWR